MLLTSLAKYLILRCRPADSFLPCPSTHQPPRAHSCFADLALTSPEEYFKEGSGSLMQCVITPAAPYMAWTNERIAEETDRQASARQGWLGARKRGRGRGSGEGGRRGEKGTEGHGA